MGKFGRLLGCSNYTACDYTRNLQRARNRPESRGQVTLRLRGTIVLSDCSLTAANVRRWAMVGSKNQLP